MKCLFCGYCCVKHDVVIVDDPRLGITEGNLKVKRSNVRCQHLKGKKPGEFSCAIHAEPWYKKTPCFRHGQIERSVSDNCRMGDYLLNGAGKDLVKDLLKNPTEVVATP